MGKLVSSVGDKVIFNLGVAQKQRELTMEGDRSAFFAKERIVGYHGN
jgi:hypothetical protein